MISNEDFLYKSVSHLDDFNEKILSYRDREKVVDNWLRLRYKEVLPMVMKRSGILNLILK